MKWLVRIYLQRQSAWALWESVIAEFPDEKEKYFQQHLTLQAAVVILGG